MKCGKGGRGGVEVQAEQDCGCCSPVVVCYFKP